MYSQKFCDADQAEKELRHALNLTDSDADARHLRMQVGRLNKHWEGNCLAIGLAQGFIEPLEATALMLVQYALHSFIEHWDGTPISNAKQEIYNTEINRMFDGVRDYIAAHYLLNDRVDTDYWKACREQMVIPDTLSFLLEAWDSDACFEQALNQVDNNLVYLRPSWYCILAGMNRFKNTSTNSSTCNLHMKKYWEGILSNNFTLTSR